MTFSKRFVFVCTAGISLMLTGCVNLNKLTKFSYPEPSSEISPIEYTFSWIDFDRGHLFVSNPLEQITKSMTELYKEKIHTDEGYQKINFKWCSSYNYYYKSISPTLETSLTELCEMKGGKVKVTYGQGSDTYERTNWCQKPDTKEVIFVFAEEMTSIDGMNCVNPYATGRQMFFAAPLENNPNAWKNFINENGFFEKTQAREEAAWNRSRQVREQWEKLEFERAREIWQAQRNADIKRILNTRGLRICRSKYEGTVFPRYIGFVEDSANGKVKVNVVEMQITPTFSQGNFQPTITWEYPDNWMICE